MLLVFKMTIKVKWFKFIPGICLKNAACSCILPIFVITTINTFFAVFFVGK